MLRRLRYAPAVAFALLALALVGLWVRSYRWSEELNWRQTANWRAIGVYSGAGRVGVSVHPRDAVGSSGIHFIGPYNLNLKARPVWEQEDRAIPNLWGFGAGRMHGRRLLMTPHWFLALLSLALAVLLAFKPITRFTVRGLLITTTLVAAVLGAVVYAL